MSQRTTATISPPYFCALEEDARWLAKLVSKEIKAGYSKVYIRFYYSALVTPKFLRAFYKTLLQEHRPSRIERTVRPVAGHQDIHRMAERAFSKEKAPATAKHKIQDKKRNEKRENAN